MMTAEGLEKMEVEYKSVIIHYKPDNPNYMYKGKFWFRYEVSPGEWRTFTGYDWLRDAKAAVDALILKEAHK